MAPLATLDPAAALDEIPGALGQTPEKQIDRPPLLLERLRIPCACGLRLAACRYEFHGDTMHVKGLCLDCGEQRAIFAPPREQDARAESLAIVEAMIGRVEAAFAEQERDGDGRAA